MQASVVPAGTLLSIACIRRDGGTQPRATLNLNWVEEYGQDMLAGAVFPPPIVVLDGTDYWLADGFHRIEAALAIGQTDIVVDVRQGTLRDAILFSLGANGKHGQRRTNDDKRRAVQTMLDDAEWSRWSDREIARQCGVSDPFVGKLRPKQPASANRLQIAALDGRLVQRNGTTYTQRAKTPKAAPQAAQVAKDLGITEADLAKGDFIMRNSGPELRRAIAEATVPNINVAHEIATLPPKEQAAKVASLPRPTFDREAADLRVAAMTAVSTVADLPSPRAVMDASNKHFGRGVLPEAVERAAAWLTEFAALYRREEPLRVQRVRDWVQSTGASHVAAE